MKFVEVCEFIGTVEKRVGGGGYQVLESLANIQV